MELSTFIYIFKIYLILYIFLFLFSLPFEIYFIQKKKELFHLGKIFGFSIFTLLLTLLHKLLILNYFIHLSFFYFFILLSFFLLNKKLFKNLFDNFKKLYLESLLISFFSFLIIHLFIFFQGSNAPYIPSYEVNHDPIPILMAAKYLNNNYLNINNIEINEGGIVHARNILNHYPNAFILHATLLKNIFVNYDLYNIFPILNFFIYTLTFYPLFVILRTIRRDKINNFFLYLIVFITLIGYFQVQMVNQSFYSQNFLVPIYLSITFFINYLLDLNKFLKSNVFLLSILLTTALFVYSFTIIVLLLFLFLLLFFYLLIRKKHNKLFLLVITSAFSFFLSLTLLTFTYPQLTNSFFLSTPIFHNRELPSTEVSFFTMKGNTIGFASPLIAFNSWFGLDFRISNIAFKYKTISFIYFLFLLLSFLYYNIKYKIKTFILLFLFSNLLLIFFVRFFTDSPYIFGKVLFYSSFLFVSLSLYSIFALLAESKNYFYKILAFIFLFFYINNSLRSFNYFGRPPIDKFNELSYISNYFLDKKYDKPIITIDDEDWAKYFLFDIGSCVTFARTYSCGNNHIKFNNSNQEIKIIRRGYYTVANKYIHKIIYFNKYEVLFKGNNYSVIFVN